MQEQKSSKLNKFKLYPLTKFNKNNNNNTKNIHKCKCCKKIKSLSPKIIHSHSKTKIMLEITPFATSIHERAKIKECTPAFPEVKDDCLFV